MLTIWFKQNIGSLYAGSRVNVVRKLCVTLKVFSPCVAKAYTYISERIKHIIRKKYKKNHNTMDYLLTYYIIRNYF